ncbi:MAG TPA: glycosyltransferase [Deltaproteobacteria bacterium]|jgi:glycosyltransferase involved in cell wall biosynthesis|nr:glycosyltransferase [Deltaproteobacteria bacterium]
MSKKISFIIPVLNGEKYIGNCLDHIIAEKDEHDDIIVVDNGSIDRTLEIVKNYPEVKIVVKPDATIAGLRNCGAKLSKNDLFAFIDCDCLVCRGWRTAIIKTMFVENVGATGSVCDVPEKSTWVERAWNSQRYSKRRPVSYIPSANFIIKREVFELIGGFSEHLITDEDTDICYKISKAGYIIIEEPNAKVIHLRNASTLREFAKKEKWHATSLHHTMFTNGLIDKSSIMTVLYALGIICAIPIILFKNISACLSTRFLVSFSIMIFIPFITAAYRIVQFKNYKYFIHLNILYHIYYIVRVNSLLIAYYKKFRSKL